MSRVHGVCIRPLLVAVGFFFVRRAVRRAEKRKEFESRAVLNAGNGLGWE